MQTNSIRSNLERRCQSSKQLEILTWKTRKLFSILILVIRAILWWNSIKWNVSWAWPRQIDFSGELPTDVHSAEVLSVLAVSIHAQNIVKCNTFMLHTMELPGLKLKHKGRSIPLFGSLINHSCDPNVQTIFVDNKIVFYILKPVKENEELFVSYW